MRFANEVVEDIESLPYGDPEGDHSLLDKYTLETLNLCLEKFRDLDDAISSDDLQNLLHQLIQKWEDIHDTLWYA